MKYTVTISDGGVRIEQEIQSANIQAAVELIRVQAAEAEGELVDRRDEWTASIDGNSAECRLRSTGDQDSGNWAKITIMEAA